MDINFVLPAALTPLCTVLLVLILGASGIMSGLSGFGFSAIGAISLSLLSPSLAIPLLMALSTANQLLSIGQLKADMKPLKQWWPDGPGPYLAGGIVGAPIGLWLLQKLPSTALLLAFGAFLMAYAVYSMLKPDNLAIQAKQNVYSSLAVGGIGGALGGVTAFPGAAVVIWAGLTKLPKNETRGIVQPYILIMQIFSLLILAVINPSAFSAEFWTLFFLMLPVVLPCTLIGTKIYKKVSDFNFRRIAFVLLGSSGLGIFIKGSHSLKVISQIL